MVEPGVDEVVPEPVRERLDAALAAAGDDLEMPLAVIGPRPWPPGQPPRPWATCIRSSSAL
jgi:hypothetical protein